MRPYKREKITAVTMLTAFGLTVAAMANPALASTIDTSGKISNTQSQESWRSSNKHRSPSFSKKTSGQRKSEKKERRLAKGMQHTSFLNN